MKIVIDKETYRRAMKYLWEDGQKFEKGKITKQEFLFTLGGIHQSLESNLEKAETFSDDEINAMVYELETSIAIPVIKEGIEKLKRIGGKG